MIFTGEASCENCSHNKVCGRKIDFVDAKRKAEALRNELNNYFTLSIKCDEFAADNNLTR